jgi:chemotaxis protein MotB
MSFAAAKQLVPSLGDGVSAGDADGLPWENTTDNSLAKQETWLLSFIDILALLLTLFVLLLAYQDHTSEDGGTEPGPTRVQETELDLSLFAFRPGEALHADFGHSGPGLLPLAVDNGYPVATAAEERPVESVIDKPESDNPQFAEVADAEVPDVEPTAVEPVAEQQSADAPPVEIPDSEYPVDAETVATVAEQPMTPLPEMEGPVRPTPSEIIHQAFSQSPLQQHVDLVNRTGAVSVEISGSILFGLGSAEISAEGRSLLNELAEILNALPYELSVEGHTDNVPISSSRFPSNWELSSARAAMATRALIEQGIAADRLRAIGYGDTHPLSDNLTPEGRAKNRRVSFVLHVDDAQSD